MARASARQSRQAIFPGAALPPALADGAADPAGVTHREPGAQPASTSTAALAMATATRFTRLVPPVGPHRRPGGPGAAGSPVRLRAYGLSTTCRLRAVEHL